MVPRNVYFKIHLDSIIKIQSSNIIERDGLDNFAIYFMLQFSLVIGVVLRCTILFLKRGTRFLLLVFLQLQKLQISLLLICVQKGIRSYHLFNFSLSFSLLFINLEICLMVPLNLFLDGHNSVYPLNSEIHRFLMVKKLLKKSYLKYSDQGREVVHQEFFKLLEFVSGNLEYLNACHRNVGESILGIEDSLLSDESISGDNCELRS